MAMMQLRKLRQMSAGLQKEFSGIFWILPDATYMQPGKCLVYKNIIVFKTIIFCLKRSYYSISWPYSQPIIMKNFLFEI